MRPTETDVDDHLRRAADRTLTEMDAIITGILTGRSRRLWVGTFWGGTEQEIIGYADIAQPRPRGRSVEWFAVGLAPQKNRYSLYVNVADEGRYLSRRYAERLGRVKVGAAAIAFEDVDSFDRDALTEMLRHVDRLTPP
ncbi:hypothetical protein [Nocardiopsis lambiniae]|uniref:DUF1801 domain-containing protein n=1 Tax=Nocardiopsis lambiniae TaxID=3075539 RepID=A0ABU2MDX9_9ACTN|nr:hypothetical protein [Nocardiopsis sp. DSM 44743]MDT0330874.1 hypothetical protein [Nocardiopsis sp. DSM 44743]